MRSGNSGSGDQAGSIASAAQSAPAKMSTAQRSRQGKPEVQGPYEVSSGEEPGQLAQAVSPTEFQPVHDTAFPGSLVRRLTKARWRGEICCASRRRCRIRVPSLKRRIAYEAAPHNGRD